MQVPKVGDDSKFNPSTKQLGNRILYEVGPDGEDWLWTDVVARRLIATFEWLLRQLVAMKLTCLEASPPFGFNRHNGMARAEERLGVIERRFGAREEGDSWTIAGNQVVVKSFVADRPDNGFPGLRMHAWFESRDPCLFADME